MRSFMQTCQDKDLIKRWILVDDGSRKEDIDWMKRKYPFFEVYTNKPKKGQPVSLNKIISLVETEWFFHCEDDWMFLKPRKFIRKLFDIANDDSRIKNIILTRKTGNVITRNNITYNLHKYDPVMEPPLAEVYSKRILEEDCNWFGYSWNPGLHHIPTLKLVGELDEDHNTNSRKWDRNHALKYLELGFKRANPMECVYIEHIGDGQSEYIH
jgi:hypothetical protein